VEGLQPESLGSVVSDFFAVGAFQYLAWYAIFRLLGSSNSTPTAQWRDLLIVTALCLLLLVPTSRMVWLAATGVSVYLWFFNRGDAKLRAAGIILGALSVQELWGHIFFNLVALPLLRAETAVVGTVLAAARAGTMWQDNIITGPSGFGIVVYTGCSSFHNLSLAMLCWITISKLRHQTWRGRDLIGGAIVGVVMIVLNFIRLYLMAWDVNLFEYWHNGTGAEIFAIGSSLTVLVISLCGSPRSSS
jgi:hypothetical protein